MQTLVDRHPAVLPIATVEPAFWRAVPVCREPPLRSGTLDNLLVTPGGDFVLAERKLWCATEARRAVRAHI